MRIVMNDKSIIVDETKEYVQFNKHKANRKTNEKLVVRLIKSIENKNLLKCNPIVVDKHFNVIDGQHRLEAAKRLGLPISYIIDEDIDVEDIIPLNVEKETWKLDEYLNFHCNQDDAYDYRLLESFMATNNFPKVNIALELLHGCRNSEFHTAFKKGFYKFPEQEELSEALQKKNQIDHVINYIKLKTSGPKTYLDKVTFYSAMVEFFNIKSMSYQVFMQKLQYKIDLIHPCPCRGDYVRIFKEIYDFKNRSPIGE